MASASKEVKDFTLIWISLNLNSHVRPVPVVLASAALNCTAGTEEPYQLGAHFMFSFGPHAGGWGQGDVAGPLPVGSLPPASLGSFPGRPPAWRAEPLEQL